MMRWRFLRGGRAFAAILALAAAALAFAVRENALRVLPVDYDEPLYLSIAQGYAAALRDGQLAGLLDDAVPENPQLMKLVFGAALVPLPAQAPVHPDASAPQPADLLAAARRAAAILGALQAAALAIVNPAAGILLALHSRHARYTAEVMLEAGPALTSMLCVLAYVRARGRWNRWMAASGILLGLTAAGKYLYCLAGVAVVADAAIAAAQSRTLRPLGALLPWGALALAVFAGVSPHLWPDPVIRTLESAGFHVGSTTTRVNTDRYVGWQPLAWLLAPVAWRPDAFPIRIDAAIAVVGALGAPVLWRRQRAFALWLVMGVVFLVAYANKLPQYSLVVTAPLCLSAGELAREALARRTKALGKLIAAGAPLAAAALAGALFLGGLPQNADPSFREATGLILEQIGSGEIALALVAEPGLSGGVFEAGWRSWNELPSGALAPSTVTLDYPSAARLLDRVAAGKRGVWLLSYRGPAGDPADQVQTLLQRQAPLNGPSMARDLPRDYALAHYRFNEGYAPTPSSFAPAALAVSPGTGPGAILEAKGCGQFRTTRAGDTLEVACLWRIASYVRLPWETRVRLTVQDLAGRPVAEAGPLIARSGFPWNRFEGDFVGIYRIELPAGTAPGAYRLIVQPSVDGAPSGPRAESAVTLAPR